MANQPTPVIRQSGKVARSENPERRGFSREDFTGGNNPSASQGSVHPDDQSLSGRIRPTDLKDYDGPLFVVNQMSDMISHDDGKGNVMRIEPKWHRDSVMPLPIEVARHPGFQRLWRTGRVQVTTDPSVEDFLTLADGPEDQGGILPYVLDSEKNNQLSPLECLICHDLIFLSQEDQDNGLPALCEAHLDSVGMIEQVRDANDNLVWQLKDTVLRRSL
jgi:hypothetical protein